MAKSEMIAAFVEPNIKAGLKTIASFSPDTNLSDEIRTASRDRIETIIQDLERRIVAAEQLGLTDVQAHERLQAVRAAYASPSEN